MNFVQIAYLYSLYMFGGHAEGFFFLQSRDCINNDTFRVFIFLSFWQDHLAKLKLLIKLLTCYVFHFVTLSAKSQESIHELEAKKRKWEFHPLKKVEK